MVTFTNVLKYSPTPYTVKLSKVIMFVELFNFIQDGTGTLAPVLSVTLPISNYLMGQSALFDDTIKFRFTVIDEVVPARGTSLGGVSKSMYSALNYTFRSLIGAVLLITRVTNWLHICAPAVTAITGKAVVPPACLLLTL